MTSFRSPRTRLTFGDCSQDFLEEILQTGLENCTVPLMEVCQIRSFHRSALQNHRGKTVVEITAVWTSFLIFKNGVYGHKKSIIGAQFFQRPLNCWAVCGTLFNKIYRCPYFPKTCRASALCTMPFFLLDPQHFVISSGYRVV